MDLTREILTIQLGNYSNYIGAHWWNLQEAGFNFDPSAEPSEINHDILYREGVDFKGRTTYTPRVLLVDLQSSLGHLSPEGSLYVDSENFSTIESPEKKAERVKEEIGWEKSSIEVVKEESTQKPEFQKDIDNPNVDIQCKEYNLSENVETWSDYLYARYHPRTVNIIKEYKVSTERETFDTYSNGAKLWESEQFQYEFTDKIRQYVEECNNCQGFQTIFDCSNGFSGLSLKCLEHLNDEYSKAALAIPVFSPRSILFENADGPMTDSIRTANIALAYSNLVEQSSIFVPISVLDRAWRQLGSARIFPFLNYKEANLYQSSAVLASFLDTITLRYRFRDPTYSSYLSGFCTDLTNYGRKLSSAAFAFPFSMRSDQDLIECIDKFEGQVFTSISPNTKIGTDYVVQSVSVRGIPKNRLKKPLKQAQHQMKMAAYKCESVSEMFQLYFQCENHASMAHVSAIQAPLPVKTPFPSDMFDSHLNFEGFIRDFERSDEEKIVSVPTVASVQTSGDLADTLESLHREASRIKISKLHRFTETGLEPDDYLESLETLLQFKDNYEDNFQL